MNLLTLKIFLKIDIMNFRVGRKIVTDIGMNVGEHLYILPKEMML